MTLSVATGSGLKGLHRRGKSQRFRALNQPDSLRPKELETNV